MLLPVHTSRKHRPFISTEMIFYMLSNNHINDLIVHPFNFANEEILSHYISFLKTLSLRLDPQTIQFFFNAQAQDFPLVRWKPINK